MVLKSNASLVLVLSFTLLFSAMVSGTETCSCPSPKPKSPPKPAPTPKPTPTPTTKPTPTPPTKPTPTSAPTKSTCPRDTLKLGVCGDLLGGLVGVVLGSSSKPCCTLIQGLADLDAAVCLCTAIRANVLGINLNVPVSLSLILNACDKKVPKGFKCA